MAENIDLVAEKSARRTFNMKVLDVRDNDDERIVKASLSSETPVRREYGDEVLDHSPSSVDLERAKDGLPLLFDHQSGQPIGIVEGVRLVGRKLVGNLRFGKSALAREVWEDVRDGILKYISIGYAIHRAEPEGDGIRVIRWSPAEASVVGVPADHTVGINRKRRKKMSSNAEVKTGDKSSKNKGPEKSERGRVSEILAIGKLHNFRDEAESAVREGVSIEKFRNLVLEKIGERGSTPMSTAHDMFSEGRRSMADYSLQRVVRARLENDWSEAGYEREVSQQLNRMSGRSAAGIYVPTAALVTRAPLSSSTTASVVGTEHMGSLFIDTLKNEAMVMQLGATVLHGLSKNVSIPRMTAGTSAEWVNEGSAPTESAPTFDNVSLSPKNISALVSYTRQLLIQSDPVIEDLMRTDLRSQIAIAIDAAAINGSGVAPVPEGILNTTGIGAVSLDTNGADPTWEMVVDLAKSVASDNALIGEPGYLTNADTVAKLRKTPRQSSGVEGNFILNDDVEQLGGYKLGVSNSVPGDLTKGSGTDLSAMIFGNWKDLLIGEFGMVDLIVDPYTGAAEGNVRIAAHASFDISVRHPESFAAVVDIVTT